ncbi:MAG TPA: M48 family peptidase [Bryobacteraceae bacterium]|jgi:hypothetical protein|nr:M48 family peptidase [Bryobacteraceae bacterium]
MSLASALLFESLEALYTRIHLHIKPSSDQPSFDISFYPFANANSVIRIREDKIEVRITDVLEKAPAPILESLAFILLCKLYRQPIPRSHLQRYRLYMNRKDVRVVLSQVRRERGRKYHRGPQGNVYDLIRMFEDLNFRFFHGLMARPDLGWSLRPSRTLLGHYDPCHHAIVISSILDRENVPALALEYVLYHEMLHLKHPAEHRGTRRCVHTREFREAEKKFPRLNEAKEMLRCLS